MELGTTDPVTGDKKTFSFIRCWQYPSKTHRDSTLKNYHVTMTYVGPLVLNAKVLINPTPSVATLFFKVPLIRFESCTGNIHFLNTEIILEFKES